MRRNKETRVKAQERLCPLTERILAQMGREGFNIRKRLQLFYQRRRPQNQPREDPA